MATVRKRKVSVPVNSRYLQGVALANKTYETGTNLLAGQEAAVHHQYDDPSNPFNRQALLRSRYEEARRGTQVNLAASGQLYSGALRNALSAARKNYEERLSANQDSENAALNDLKMQQATLGSNRDQSLYDLEGQRIQDALLRSYKNRRR